ncbi:uncharacterized protein ASPGLDRAFT_69911 [Aspergillus glaucus CBS 516.65]|uniref:Amidohydrolase-related domain-containing protein n=1 Tax=Aspergillus glaucus CBS 516.65 TaxID=1160497 RepID=A0A1L9V7B3_ASPGL|nr:hypothetical protein ASPGLDRAFT_69911 [Aspergillus glaucus CBS 516.65]OJJ79800.1 hypothetical protein ASPGLDRAFT_69911 [Aspergillus glaucus CBS 516.65]
MTKVLKDGTALTFDDSTQSIRVLPKASIIIENDRIAAISEDSDFPIPQYAEIINVHGKIVFSRFYQHSHPHMADSHMSPATAAFTPDVVYISSLEGYIEGLHGGVTSYVEHAHNNWKADVVEPGFDAAVDSGARVWWCYDEGSPVQLGLSVDGLSGLFGNDPDGYLKYMREMIRKLNIRAIAMHHLGGPWPARKTAPSDIDLSALQTTNLPIIYSHAPFLTESDQKGTPPPPRENNQFISITPESEFHFGHGQTTGHLISDQASLGLDTNWTFSGDMLSQTSLWLQNVRLTKSHRTLEAGKLPRTNPFPVEEAVGAKADLVVFNGDSPNMLGWSDPIAAVVLHANPGDVAHVLVDGEFRKRDFKLVDKVLAWGKVRERFLEASRHIQEQIKEPPPMPERLWGVSEFGDVEMIDSIELIQ